MPTKILITGKIIMMINGILGHPLKKPRSIKLWKNFLKKRH